jgi:hypothetical protein
VSRVTVFSFTTPVFGVLLTELILTEESTVEPVSLILALVLVCLGVLTLNVDFERLFRQLKKFGYSGDIVIEHEMYTRPDRDGDILKSREHLEALIKKIFETEE